MRFLKRGLWVRFFCGRVCGWGWGLGDKQEKPGSKFMTT